MSPANHPKAQGEEDGKVGITGYLESQFNIGGRKMMKQKCYGCQTPVEAEGGIDEKLVLCDHCGDIMEGLTWASRVNFDRLYEQQQLAKANGEGR